MQSTKYSKQREMIYTMVRDNPIHPTAETVYYYLKKNSAKLSLGTVYRNLQQLSTNGDLLRITIPNAPDRYDGNTTPHYHMVCEKCGDVSDIDIPYLIDIDNNVKQKTGYDITKHDIIFKTICSKCKE